MQIRLSPEAAAAANHGRMTVDEFLARFPEVPRDLKDEPVLAQYVDAFGLLLRAAKKPKARKSSSQPSWPSPAPTRPGASARGTPSSSAATWSTSRAASSRWAAPS